MIVAPGQMSSGMVIALILSLWSFASMSGFWVNWCVSCLVLVGVVGIVFVVVVFLMFADRLAL